MPRVTVVKDRTETIATLVHEYLIRSGRTEIELAELVGVHQTQISRWKRGTGVPRASYVPALAELFDLPVDVVENAREEGERVRAELVEKKVEDPREEVRRLRRELRSAQAKVKRLEDRLRREE